MTEETARQILHSLLTEKDIAAPTPVAQGSEAENHLLIERVLSPEASGSLPEALVRALAETFDAIALTAGNDTISKTDRTP
jgi:hypothetical protein